MAGFLDDILADDAAFAFLDGDAFAEQITVSTTGTVAGERTVYALVDRSPPAVVEGGGKVRAPKLRITLANHATLGIAATAHNAGKSYVKVAPTRGGTVETLTITGKPQTQDAGLLTFEW